MGATRRWEDDRQRNTDFNPHPLAGATAFDGKSYFDFQFQSTPPCGGDEDTVSYNGNTYKFQSTPPCGGDHQPDQCLLCPDISIHAPMRGRLYVYSDESGVFDNFNPRPHAGATCKIGSSDIFFNYFNPRPHAGATLHPESFSSGLQRFQSTPPCGGDRFADRFSYGNL